MADINQENQTNLVKVEGNLSEYPFFTFARSKQKEFSKVFQFEPRVLKDGRIEKRSLKIEAPPSQSLPSAFDMDVLMAISLIATSKQSITEEIHFSLYEVASLLGLNPKKSNLIKKSILKMVSVFCQAEHTVMVKDGEDSRYLTSTEAFHIIESSGFIDLNSGRHSNRESRQNTYIKFNHYFIKNFLSGYFQLVDFNSYLTLETPTAKRLYVYLSKKKGNKASFRISVDKLAAVIPIEAKKKTKVRQVIRDASSRLVEQEILEKFILNWGDDVITFIFPQPKLNAIKMEKPETLLEKMVAVGVNSVRAQELINEFPAEKIQQQIEWLTRRQAPNPPAYLVKAIKEDWKAPLPTIEDESVIDSEQLEQDKELLSQVYEQARNSSYIITKKGKRFSIHSVTSSAIEIVYPEDSSKSMIRMIDAVGCSFE